MGVMKQIWREFTINNVTPFDFNYIFWNTYERDWYASEKDLGSGTRNGKTIYLVGRRSNSSDIYGYQPGNLNSRSEEHTSELQSRPHLVCRLLLEKKKKKS